MADQSFSRAAFRGRGRGGGGNPSGGGRGAAFSGPRNSGGGQQSHHAQGQSQWQAAEKPKKENILNFERYMDKQLRVKFNGGREVTGTLKGYDQLMNLVLEDVEEFLTNDEGEVTTRKLGLVVARSTLLTEISPVAGSQQIENPFLETAE